MEQSGPVSPGVGHPIMFNYYFTERSATPIQQENQSSGSIVRRWLVICKVFLARSQYNTSKSFFCVS